MVRLERENLIYSWRWFATFTKGSEQCPSRIAVLFSWTFMASFKKRYDSRFRMTLICAVRSIAPITLATSSDSSSNGPTAPYTLLLTNVMPWTSTYHRARGLLRGPPPSGPSKACALFKDTSSARRRVNSRIVKDRLASPITTTECYHMTEQGMSSPL